MKRIIYLSGFAVALFAIFAISCQRVEEQKVVEKVSLGKIALLVAEGFHDGEAYMPKGFLNNQGFDVVVLGIDSGMVKAYNSNFTINIEKAVRDVSVDDFVALVIPGGTGPGVLRDNQEVIDFVSRFWETGKVVAAICHGPQVLVTAGLLEGRTATSLGAIQGEMEGAGVNFVDQSVVVDGNLITSRIPEDMFDFSKAIADALLQP